MWCSRPFFVCIAGRPYYHLFCDGIYAPLFFTYFLADTTTVIVEAEHGPPKICCWLVLLCYSGSWKSATSFLTHRLWRHARLPAPSCDRIISHGRGSSAMVVKLLCFLCLPYTHRSSYVFLVVITGTLPIVLEKRKKKKKGKTFSVFCRIFASLDRRALPLLYLVSYITLWSDTVICVPFLWRFSCWLSLSPYATVVVLYRSFWPLSSHPLSFGDTRREFCAWLALTNEPPAFEW